MKFIPKNEEPVAFSDWKEQEAERLEVYYSANNAGAAWNHLPSKPPINPEAGFHYYSKEELTAELLEEQGHLCCYCNRLIHQESPVKNDVAFNDRRTTIEHLDAKKDDAGHNTFRFHNLVASCSGGEKLIHPRFSYCNSKRGDKLLPVKPTHPDCEKLVKYSIDGQIFGETAELTAFLYDGLGLDYFNEVRSAEIRAMYYENLSDYNSWNENENDGERPELIPISQEKARKLVDELSQKEGEPKKYREFCSAVIYVLKNDILREV